MADNSPLLPPTLIKPLQGNNERVHLRNVDDARTVYRDYRNISFDSRSTKCNYLHGSRYEYLFDGCYEILDHEQIGDFDLKVEVTRTDQTKTTSWVKVRKTTNASLLESIVTMGRVFSNNRAPTIRGHRGDGGKMWQVGCYTIKGKEAIYSKATDSIRNSFNQWTKKSKEVLESIFPMEMKEIREKNLARGLPLNEDETALTMVLSEDLENSLHIDIDEDYGVVVFAEKVVGDASNWLFVLGNVTRDGHRAIVIKKNHGLCVCWHGKDIFHASARMLVTGDNHVYGAWISSLMIKKIK